MKTKHTKGKWRLALDKNGNLTKVEADYVEVHNGILIRKNNIPVAELEANANLIAEAGTVATESGLTPRQLLEQRNELLEALNQAQFIVKRKGIEEVFRNEAALDTIDQRFFRAKEIIESAIAKATETQK